MDTDKMIALAQHLDESVIDFMTESGTDNEVYYIGDIEDWDTDEYATIGEYCEAECTTLEDWFIDHEDDYKILTDEEADEEHDEALDNYIEECILPEIPSSYRYYFDSEKWKRDARYDGRGHSLAHYDGVENEETVNGTTYYIYRIG